MELTWHPFSFKFPQPIHLKTGNLTLRKGITLHLKSDTAFGEGEASPLPGFSTETLQDIEKRLSLIQKKCKAKTQPPVADILSGDLGLSKNMPPSLYFGLELAMLNNHAKRLKVPLATLLLPYTGATRLGEAKKNTLLP